jgi:hypothetical protein
MSIINTPASAVSFSDLASATADLNVADLLAILSSSGVNRKLTIGALAEAMRKSAIVTSSFTIIAAGWRRAETYVLSAAATAAATATLPSLASVIPGTRFTFKNKNTLYAFTAACTGSDTIGTTGSTSFILYSRDDYVTLESDGVNWEVVASSGPVFSSTQTAAVSVSVSSAWAAIGSGLSLGTLPPGIYDFEIDASIYTDSNILYPIAIGIGNGATLISGSVSHNSIGGCPAHISIKGYKLLSAAVIQGLYYGTSGHGIIMYDSTYVCGVIQARRIG